MMRELVGGGRWQAWRWRWGVSLVVVGFVLLAAQARASAAVRIETLSNRADLVSGSEALVRVDLPRSVQPSSVRVLLNGSDVSSQFAVRPTGEYEGLLRGLGLGANVVEALLPGGSGARLTIIDHPTGGPVFSGPQIQPWVCGTEAAGLGSPVDEQCDAPSTYSYKYKSTTSGQFESYNPTEPPPSSEIATTTTDQGVTVPYIVRLEKGTQDRGLYEIGVLDDPNAGWEPWAPQPGWNHKLLVPFGASTAPHHSQDAPTSVLVNNALSRGFMVADSGLNVQGSDANANVSAEALMMLKEHIADSYGRIRYTIGEGCSGGGLQQYMVAAMYPGLVNGIQPNCSFADMWTTAPDVGECHGLIAYFEKHPEPWVPQLDGHHDPSDCEAWNATFWPVSEPGKASNCNLPESEVYNPETNPEGARCDLQDYQVDIWGPRPQSEWGPVEQRIHKGFAIRPFDNVGVQYGLKALEGGLITPAEFANLNSSVGCFDLDDHPTAQRCAISKKTAITAYKTSQITDARRLADVPIIDLRGWSETAEIHTSVYSYMMRARLDAENGNHDNQVIWTYRGTAPILGMSTAVAPQVALKSFLLMDHWLSAVEADQRKVALAQKVREDKPGEAVDACFPDNTAGSEITDAAACEAQFPHYETTRMATGGPLSGQILKCQLKPLSRSEFSVAFTEEEWAQLQGSFPTGVCDYSKPGVGERPSVPWISFASGPGGKPLGRPPASRAFAAG